MKKNPDSPLQSESESVPVSEVLSSTTPTTEKLPRRIDSIRQYQFKPGNPGRPKGSKNRITSLKLGLEEALRDHASTYMHEVLATAIEMALSGDRTMVKLLLELHMSKPQAVEDENQGKEKIQVNIKNLTLDKNTKFVRKIEPIIGSLEEEIDDNEQVIESEAEPVGSGA